MNTVYSTLEPARADIDKLGEPALLEFGTPWCGYCRAAQPLIAAAMANHQSLTHIKVADGSGRPLGRSFGVKLWPTLIFLKDGVEVSRLVRPSSSAQVNVALAAIHPVDDRDQAAPS